QTQLLESLARIFAYLIFRLAIVTGCWLTPLHHDDVQLLPIVTIKVEGHGSEPIRPHPIAIEHLNRRHDTVQSLRITFLGFTICWGKIGHPKNPPFGLFPTECIAVDESGTNQQRNDNKYAVQHDVLISESGRTHFYFVAPSENPP